MTDPVDEFSDEELELLQEEVEESEKFSSVEDMLENRHKKTLSFRMPIGNFVRYETFARENGFSSKSEAAREAVRKQVLGQEREKLLTQGWSTYLAGLNESDPHVTALGLDTLYEASETHGRIAEKYMDSLLEKTEKYSE